MNLDVQIASECNQLPDSMQFEKWVEVAIKHRSDAEVVIRLVDEAESAELNQHYRQKEGPTNVLSFPFEMPEALPKDALNSDILGDIVICAPIVINEALEQKKPTLSHWAHLVIHGCLHLQGYDHIEEKGAMEMEGLEISLLSSVGINNPYEG